MEGGSSHATYARRKCLQPPSSQSLSAITLEVGCHHLLPVANMTSTELDLLVPLAAPLPPLPQGEVLSSSQWTTLLAVADTLIPSIRTSTDNDHSRLFLEESEYAAAVQKLQTVVPNEAGREAISQYLQESAGSTPGFRDSLQRIFGSHLREDALKGIRVLLSALEWVEVYVLVEVVI